MFSFSSRFAQNTEHTIQKRMQNKKYRIQNTEKTTQNTVHNVECKMHIMKNIEHRTHDT